VKPVEQEEVLKALLSAEVDQLVDVAKRLEEEIDAILRLAMILSDQGYITSKDRQAWEPR
jgi:hypothetical protein